MTNEQLKMLIEIQELEFSAIDLNLFLDTHPGDNSALKEYNQLTKRKMELEDKYQKLYGPLTNFGTATSEYPWRWAQSPWPWEIEYPPKG